jgi:hypothetical protein
VEREHALSAERLVHVLHAAFAIPQVRAVDVCC